MTHPSPTDPVAAVFNATVTHILQLIGDEPADLTITAWEPTYGDSPPTYLRYATIEYPPPSDAQTGGPPARYDLAFSEAHALCSPSTQTRVIVEIDDTDYLDVGIRFVVSAVTR